MSKSRAGQRLETVVATRLEESETIVHWCRVWYSRPTRWHWASARYRDYVVLTDRRLMMYSAGVLTRLPRRRVLADRLDDLLVVERDAPNRLHVSHPSHPPMLLEFDRDDTSLAIAHALRHHRARTVEADAVGEHAWPS